MRRNRIIGALFLRKSSDFNQNDLKRTDVKQEVGSKGFGDCMTETSISQFSLGHINA